MHGFQGLRLVLTEIFFYYVNLVSLLKLLKISFYKILLQGKI
jgi:hypothetical protein